MADRNVAGGLFYSVRTTLVRGHDRADEQQGHGGDEHAPRGRGQRAGLPVGAPQRQPAPGGGPQLENEDGPGLHAAEGQRGQGDQREEAEAQGDEVPAGAGGRDGAGRQT